MLIIKKMSLLGRDTFFHGTFSMAGRDSVEKFNIATEANKAEEKEIINFSKIFFSSRFRMGK